MKLLNLQTPKLLQYKKSIIFFFLNRVIVLIILDCKVMIYAENMSKTFKFDWKIKQLTLQKGFSHHHSSSSEKERVDLF